MTTPIGPAGHPPGHHASHPKWFQAITITYAIVAGLAVLGGLGAIVGLAVSRNMMGSFPTTPGADMERMRELQEQMLDAQMPWLQGPFGLLEALVGGWALYTVIRIMQRRAEVVPSFRNASLLFAAVALVRTAIDGVVQIRAMALMQDFMRETMRATPGAAPPPGFESFMERAMIGGAIMGVVWAVLWLAAKLWITLYARYYVTKEPVRAYLEQSSA